MRLYWCCTYWRNRHGQLFWRILRFCSRQTSLFSFVFWSVPIFSSCECPSYSAKAVWVWNDWWLLLLVYFTHKAACGFNHLLFSCHPLIFIVFTDEFICLINGFVFKRNIYITLFSLHIISRLGNNRQVI